MTRLLLALPLLLHLSGLSGIAAVVCASSDTPIHCCCHHAAGARMTADPSANGGSAACPCALKQRPAAPDASAVASPVASAPLHNALVHASIDGDLVVPTGHAPALPSHGGIDLSPPYLTSAPTRC